MDLRAVDQVPKSPGAPIFYAPQPTGRKSPPHGTPPEPLRERARLMKVPPVNLKNHDFARPARDLALRKRLALQGKDRAGYQNAGLDPPDRVATLISY